MEKKLTEILELFRVGSISYDDALERLADLNLERQTAANKLQEDLAQCLFMLETE